MGDPTNLIGGVGARAYVVETRLMHCDDLGLVRSFFFLSSHRPALDERAACIPCSSKRPKALDSRQCQLMAAVIIGSTYVVTY
jgi:hypothetical protein